MVGSVLLLDGGRVRIDPRARQLLVGELPAKLSGRAFDLLLALARNADRLVPKQELLDLVWPGLVVEENNLQVHVMSLRRLLGAQAIVTVSGRGYRLALPVDSAEGGGGHVPAVVPAPEQGLIGREALVAEVAGRLTAGARLLTLCGPGGAGKTRLALRVAASVAPRLPDGAHAVMLASVRDGTHLMPAIAAALGLQERPDLPSEELVRGFLRPRELLLVLDNCEHLPTVPAAVASLLQACPRLCVLATSRTLLRVGDETEVRVPPLGLPAAGSLDSPAVRLLLQSAAAIGHAIGPGAAERQAAVEICRRLDGLPLAIELAAARLRVLSPLALAARLHQRLALLTGGPADAPTRQRTLRDTLAWSHELLAADVQRLWRRLGVFVGGWSLDAAEALDVEPAGTVNRLQALLDHNLVQRLDDVDGQPRYTMLETIREFALERLAAEPEEHRQVAATHARLFLNVMVAAEAQLRSRRRKAALDCLRADRHNLRAALVWATRSQPEFETAARLVAASGWWWYFDNGFIEGERWVQAALALALPPPLRAQVLAAGARVAVYGARPTLGMQRGTEAIVLAASAGDRCTEAATLLVLAVPVLGRSRDEALALVQRSVALYRELADPWGLALAISYLGVVLAWAPGTEAEAEPWLREGRQRFGALGDAWGMATTTGYMGVLAARRGDLEAARRHAEETLAACIEVGDQFRVVGQRLHLAHHARKSGDLPLAIRRADECIATRWAQGHERDTLLLCRWRALLSFEAGQMDQALVLFAVGSTDLDEDASLTGTVASVSERAEWQAALVALRQLLPASSFSRRWHDAAARPLGQVLADLDICAAPNEDSENFSSRP